MEKYMYISELVQPIQKLAQSSGRGERGGGNVMRKDEEWRGGREGERLRDEEGGRLRVNEGESERQRQSIFFVLSMGVKSTSRTIANKFFFSPFLGTKLFSRFLIQY